MAYRFHVRRNSVGGSGDEARLGRQGGLGYREAPNERDGRGGGTVNCLLGGW